MLRAAIDCAVHNGLCQQAYLLDFLFLALSVLCLVVFIEGELDLVSDDLLCLAASRVARSALAPLSHLSPLC